MKITLPSRYLGSTAEGNALVIYHDIVTGEGGLPIIYANRTAHFSNPGTRQTAASWDWRIHHIYIP